MLFRRTHCLVRQTGSKAAGVTPVGSARPSGHSARRSASLAVFTTQETSLMQVVEAHGARIPTIGLGTMTLKEDVCVQAVKTALQVGYHHLDTAAHYGNEVENGEGFRQSGVKREDAFICTKVRQGDLNPDDFRRVITQSLKNLQLPYVDLLLIHWPSKEVPIADTIGALCKAKKEGKTKHIGLSFFLCLA